jgi:SWIM zinc finger
MNALLKLWVDNHKSIYQFVMQIEKLIEGIWQRESDEDLKTMNETPHTYSYYQFENEACQIYTRNVFSVFKEIIKESSLGFVSEITRDVLYQVKITYHPLFKIFKPESYIIDVDRERCTITCSCKGFEVEGLLCSHCIKVMQHIGISHLPAHYILKRWTKCANTNSKRHVNERSMDSGESAELRCLRFATIKSSLMEMGRIGALTSSTFSCLKEIITDGMTKLSSLVENEVLNQEIKTIEAKKTTLTSVSLFLDPSESQCKGKRKKITRFVPAAEKNANKMRTCSICNAKEGHNARTCPKVFIFINLILYNFVGLILNYFF